MLSLNDRVTLLQGEQFETNSGESVFIPSGHEGIVVELSSFAASAQSRWITARVLLNPINGVEYTLSINPGSLVKVS